MIRRIYIAAFVLLLGCGELEPDTADDFCESNFDCAAGSVCEAGFVFDLGDLWPRATLCTVDVPRSSGPEVYGLDEWSDGISFEHERVSITRDMFEVLHEGLFHDDQRFDELGTVTHCGPDALCSFLEIKTGDTIGLDLFDVDAFEQGEGQFVTVSPLEGPARTLTVYLNN